jgi:hypothetical protein
VEIFTKKMELIYNKLFNSDIDEFTKAFINNNKFNKNKFDANNEQEAYEQFFFNRKIVLRRWLKNGIKCTKDFQKSFPYYKISKYQYKGSPLFSLHDFMALDNLVEFEKKIDSYLKEQKRIFAPIDYKYIYLFEENLNHLDCYEIIEWKKGNGFEMIIELSYNSDIIEGKVSIEANGNIFMTLNIQNSKYYFLFHDNNDNYSKYAVGISMGFSPMDNKVPIAKKVILSKEVLDIKESDLRFILNEAEVMYAIENRVSNLSINPLLKYTYRLKKYYQFFFDIVNSRFKYNFYYRLALKEFNSFRKLFQKVANGDSYFVYNYHRAFYEMIKTVESIGNIPLYIVQEFSPNHYLIQSDYQYIKIQERLFNLKNYGVEVNLIVVIQPNLISQIKESLENIVKKGVKVKIVEKDKIIHQVNSIDFAFIKDSNKNNFVIADPLRDSKDVYKIFTNSVTMEEYYSDYYKILKYSILYKKAF